MAKDEQQPKGEGFLKENAETLTPWQKANQEYLQNQGKDPAWSPTVINGQQAEETASAETETEEEYHGLPRQDSFADRLPKVKYQRTSVMYRRLLLIIAILSVPLLLAIYYVSPLSKLAAVTVIGAQAADEAQVAQAADFKVEAELWPQFFQRQEHIAAIKQANPRVKDVQISIQRLNHFQIDVTEYREVAFLAENNEYAPILENGKVMPEKQANAEANLPILENFTDETLIKNTLTQYDKLSQEIKAGISQIKSTPTDNNPELLTLFMNDQNQVIISVSNLAKQMKYYPQVAKDMTAKGVVDMEVGIYSYPYGSEETATTESSSGEVPAADTPAPAEGAEAQAAGDAPV